MLCPRCGVKNPDGVTLCKCCSWLLSGTPRLFSKRGAKTSGWAIASLASGILTPLTFGISAILAVIFAAIAIFKTEKSNSCLKGKKLAIAGLVISAILIPLTYLFLPGLSRFLVYKWKGIGEFQFNEYIYKPAPDMNLTSIDGNAIKISELMGKHIILNFWATWCPPCRKEIPHFAQLRNTTDSNQLIIIGISSEPEEVVRTFASKNNINYPLVCISRKELPEPYNKISAVPTTIFIDNFGLINNVLIGYHSLKELKRNAFGSPEFQKIREQLSKELEIYPLEDQNNPIQNHPNSIPDLVK